MAEKACHGFGSTTQVGLTQALGPMTDILASNSEELLEQIDELISLLEWDGNSTWRDRLASAGDKIRRGDKSGYLDFLSNFGTSGSFNECTIGKGAWINNVHVWQPGHEEKYRHFEQLKNAAYTSAAELYRATAPSIGIVVASLLLALLLLVVGWAALRGSP